MKLRVTIGEKTYLSSSDTFTEEKLKKLFREETFVLKVETGWLYLNLSVLPTFEVALEDPEPLYLNSSTSVTEEEKDEIGEPENL